MSRNRNSVTSVVSIQRSQAASPVLQVILSDVNGSEIEVTRLESKGSDKIVEVSDPQDFQDSEAPANDESDVSPPIQDSRSAAWLTGMFLSFSLLVLTY